MTISLSSWQSLNTAPRKQADSKPVEVMLFLPGIHHQTDEKGRPIGTPGHGECVGYWDADRNAWVESEGGGSVYPSLWKAIDA